MCVCVFVFVCVSAPSSCLDTRTQRLASVSRREPTHYFTKRNVFVYVCNLWVYSCFILSICVVHTCLVKLLLFCFHTSCCVNFLNFGHVCARVREGESTSFVRRRLATFKPAYGPWVWDREGVSTRARLVLVGGVWRVATWV